MTRDGSFWFEAQSLRDLPVVPTCRCVSDERSWSFTADLVPVPDYLARAALYSPEPRHLRLVASNGKAVER